jgi:hypothetical protein
MPSISETLDSSVSMGAVVIVGGTGVTIGFFVASGGAVQAARVRKSPRTKKRFIEYLPKYIFLSLY